MGKNGEKTSARRVLILAGLIAISTQLTPATQVQPRRLPSEFGDAKDPKQAYMLIENLAKEAVALDRNLGRIRVSIANGVLLYDFAPAPDSSLASRPARLTRPLEILIRTEAVGRDLRLCMPSQQFWVSRLEQLRGLAAKMVEAAYDAASEDEWLSRKQVYEAEVETKFADLAKQLLAYADKSRLDARASRGSVQGYRVEIRVDPPKAHVKYMPFLNYKRCTAFNLSPNDYWLDLDVGTRTLIGKYHYIAEWPPSLNGPEEGNFEITGEVKILRFHPKAN